MQQSPWESQGISARMLRLRWTARHGWRLRNAAVKITGCTVHYVTLEVDGGPIIDQAAVRVEETDTLETLSARVHAAEHALLPAVIARLSERFPA